jgi:hypothetical protein
MQTNWTRRSVLKAAGLSALWLPLFGQKRRAVAAAPDNRKLVFVYAEAGWTTRFFRMRPPWAPAEWSTYELYSPDFSLVPDDLEWEFDLTDSRLVEDDFSRLLKPLYRHRDVMIATEGLAMLTPALDQYGDDHAKAHIHAWSATPADSSEDGVRSRGSAPSLDQRIHDHIRTTEPGHQTMDFRLLESGLYHEWLYQSDGNGGAARLPTEIDPVLAFDRFFASADPTDPLTQHAGTSIEHAVRQFDELAPRLGQEDRLKLEAHREMLSTLTQRLGRTVSCDDSLRPGDSTTLSRPERYLADMEAFGRLIAAGLSCGLTRVATLGSITPPPEVYGLPESAAIHHEYEHPTDPVPFYDGTADDAYLEKEEWMVRRNEHQMQQLATFIDLLRATPDGDGTLLDSTLVVYLSELSHGNHGHEHFPSLLFGSGGGMVTPGRYIKYAQNNPNPFGRNYRNEYTGTAHSKLLVSIAQGFGLELDDFGTSTVPGSAPHVQGSEATLELGGPLPRLKV